LLEKLARRKILFFFSSFFFFFFFTTPQRYSYPFWVCLQRCPRCGASLSFHSLSPRLSYVTHPPSFSSSLSGKDLKKKAGAGVYLGCKLVLSSLIHQTRRAVGEYPPECSASGTLHIGPAKNTLPATGTRQQSFLGSFQAQLKTGRIPGRADPERRGPSGFHLE